MSQPETLLRQLFDVAVAAASPRHCMTDALGALQDRDYLIVGAGKAAAGMAFEVEQHFPGRTRGMVIVPYGHGVRCHNIEVVEAAHPVPDEAGVNATRRLLETVSGLSAGDAVLCLISGGGSSLLTLPADGVSLADKQAVTRALLRSGAPIADINCVRKHLSAIKGGKLAAACRPAKVITLIISDVPGNAAGTVASGPTVADSTTPADALRVLRYHGVQIPTGVLKHLQEAPQTSLYLSNPDVQVLATSNDALCAASRHAEASGTTVLSLGDLVGDARQLAGEHARLALEIAAGTGPITPPCVILSGGETTVRVLGDGLGGRNGEYALQFMIALDGHPAISAIACDTDGIDGGGDNAGCVVLPDSLQRAAERGMNVYDMQSENDSYRLFAGLDNLIMTGPTLTNVNDFRAIHIADQ